jgi:hypothetical protein
VQDIEIGLKAMVDADNSQIQWERSNSTRGKDRVGEDLPATKSTDSDRASGAETKALRECFD